METLPPFIFLGTVDAMLGAPPQNTEPDDKVDDAEDEAEQTDEMHPPTSPSSRFR
jgi:hypothetical protein